MEKKAMYWEEIEEGVQLPMLIKDVTATTVIYGALASRDFMPIHHDRDFAQKQGMKDIFMNSPATSGWISRYVTDWTGPEGELKKISMRFGRPCHPGDRLIWSAKVINKYTAGGEHLVDVEYNADVPEGRHCSGVVTISLPLRENINKRRNCSGV